MKRIIFATLCLMLALVACTNRTANKTDATESSLEVLQNGDDHWSKYINSVKGHNEQDSITGRFVDNRIDTLWFERCDKDNTDIWELRCSNKRVKTCKFWSALPKLVFEGDLDGNGTDDFGFIDTWYASNCRDYHVATIRNHAIICMLEFETAYNLRASGKDLVQKSSKKGYVHVIYSDINNGCCNAAPDVDTLMRFDYHEFDQRDF